MHKLTCTFLKNGFLLLPICVPCDDTVVPDTDRGKDFPVGLEGLGSSSYSTPFSESTKDFAWISNPGLHSKGAFFWDYSRMRTHGRESRCILLGDIPIPE